MSALSKIVPAAAVVLLCGYWIQDRIVDPVSPNIDAPSLTPIGDVASPNFEQAPIEEQASQREAATEVATDKPLRSRILNVVDRSSGAPATHFAIELHHDPEANWEDGPLAILWTDAGGMLTVQAEWLDESITLIAIDHPSSRLQQPERLTWDSASRLATPVEAEASGKQAVETLKIDLGPTYRLQLPSTPDSKVTAFLDTAGFRDSVALEYGAFLREPVTPGGLPWVRMDPKRVTPSSLGNGPWFLRLRDQQGFWQVWGEVQTIAGEHPGPIRMTGGSFGSLELYARVDGSVPTTHFTIRLKDAQQHSPDRRVIINGKGGWRAGEQSIGYLAAGNYELTVTDKSIEPASFEVEVAEGTMQALHMELQAARNRYELSVLLRSETGRITEELGYVSVVAVSSDDPTKKAWGNGMQAEGDALPVPITGLTAGRWQIELGRIAHLPAIEPAGAVEVEVGPGLSPSVEFLFRDGGDSVHQVEVLALDATNEKAVSSGAINVMYDGVGILGRGLSQGEAQLPVHRSDIDLDYVVIVPGYRPGTASDARSDDGRHILRLEAGWGALLYAQRFEDGFLLPLAGVQVILDGHSAGYTDATGYLLLAADALPNDVKFLHEQYTHTGDVLKPEAEGGSFKPGHCWTTRVTFANN
ncbi:MAG: hypothetical protein ACI835_003244 [Planctomycetota bacterium]|jgi:hypothetical protein